MTSFPWGVMKAKSSHPGAGTGLCFWRFLAAHCVAVVLYTMLALPSCPDVKRERVRVTWASLSGTECYKVYRS